MIIITADHETGGVSLGADNGSQLDLKLLRTQKWSVGGLSLQLATIRIQKPQTTWEEMKAWIASKTGLWSAIKVSPKEEEKIRNEFYSLFASGDTKTIESLYGKNNTLAVAINRLINRKANIGFASGYHSAAWVPLFAIGVGADQFLKIKDNTEIPRTIIGK